MVYSDSTFGYYIIGIAGQSNAHGWSVGIDASLDYTDPRIMQLANSGTYNDRVILASEPLAHKGGARSNEIGFAMSFARLYVQTIPSSKKVLLLPCAVGGSSFSGNDWNPGNPLAENYKVQIQKALALPGDNRFMGTLWHQGESDTDDSNEAVVYPAKIRTLVDFIRAIPGAESSFFVMGEMAPTWVQGVSAREAVQQHIRNLPDTVPFTSVASAAGLTTHDGIHFSAASERVLGERYFFALTNAAANVPPPPENRRPRKFSDSAYIGAPVGQSSGGGNSNNPVVVTPPVTPPSDGLPLALFRFNFASGSAVDISGNNRSLALTAPAAIQDAPAGRGKALRPLEGGEANVAIALPVNYTKAAWLYTPNLGMNGNIISSDSDPNHVFWSPGSDGKMSGGHANEFTEVFEDTTLPIGVWVHYALTYDSTTGTMKLYRNGVMTKQRNGAKAFTGGTAPCKLGYFQPGTNTFGGYLDKPAVWAQALTDAQILTLYNAEKLP